MTARLEELKDFIDKTEKELKAARSERDRIVRDLNSHGQLMAPIFRIPNEVTLEIFDMIIDPQRRRNDLLMRVCKVWYNLVLNTPTMWSRIDLHLTNHRSLPMLWSYGKICVERSKDIDVHASLSGYLENPTFPDYMETRYNFQESYIPLLGKQDYIRNGIAGFNDSFLELEALDELSIPEYFYAFLLTLAILRGPDDSCMARWRSFSLTFGGKIDEYNIGEIWNTLKGSTPRLKALEVSSYQIPLDIDGITGLPDLEGLKVLELACEITSSAFFSRLSGLETLLCDEYDLSSMFCSQYMHENCLRHLSLSSYDFSTMEAASSASFPLLEVLNLQGKNPSCFFTFITTPSLLRLHMLYEDSKELVVHPPNHPLLNEVTEFIFDWMGNVTVAADSVCQLVGRMPKLQRIQLRHYNEARLDEMRRIVGALLVQQNMDAEVLNGEHDPLLFTFPAYRN